MGVLTDLLSSVRCSRSSRKNEGSRPLLNRGAAPAPKVDLRGRTRQCKRCSVCHFLFSRKTVVSSLNLLVSPSSASDALSRVLPALTSQQNLDELHLDTDGTNALDAFSASGRRSPDSLLGVQSTHLADDSALTLSRVHDDVSRTLLFLTGSETLEAAETWLEKDILTDPDDESLPSA